MEMKDQASSTGRQTSQLGRLETEIAADEWKNCLTQSNPLSFLNYGGAWEKAGRKGGEVDKLKDKSDSRGARAEEAGRE
jgi:hypothetical protein